MHFSSSSHSRCPCCHSVGTISPLTWVVRASNRGGHPSSRPVARPRNGKIYRNRSRNNSEIGKNFRFVCLREEEVREMLSHEQRPLGYGECSRGEQHIEGAVATRETKRRQRKARAIMRRKQNLNVRQVVPTPSTALSATEALEQQVRAHPVVQEVMRLFDARIVAIERTGTSDETEHPAVEQQVLCFLPQV